MFSEQTASFALCNINSLVFITEMESVYSAVRPESLYNTDTFGLQRVNVTSYYPILILILFSFETISPYPAVCLSYI
jgi:hypothetical protein